MAIQASRSVDAIVDGAPDAVVVIGADGDVLRWNGRAEDLFGWSASVAVVGADGAGAGRTNIGRTVALVSAGIRLSLVPQCIVAAQSDGMTRRRTGERRKSEC